MYRLRLKQCQVNVDVDSIIANPKVYLFDYHLFYLLFINIEVFFGIHNQIAIMYLKL